MMQLYDQVCLETSKRVTQAYTTSFYYGIQMLGKELRQPIYNIYGFVRFADEIVDTFDKGDKAMLLNKFTEDTWLAIEQGVSLNPILHSFQETVNRFNVDHSHIQTFIDSMAMDLEQRTYTQKEYKKYILGSAEVVGLMCLHVFAGGDQAKYDALKPGAMKLGSAFQKINFLRDLKADSQGLGRIYFPNVDLSTFNEATKQQIEQEIEAEFFEARESIKQLPKSSRLGVYTAWVYYYGLLKKIKHLPPATILTQRVRIPNWKKMFLLFQARMKMTFGGI
ncbi:MAG: phytoene/squalene synthase family protein [Saprospiraceae bacterium]|nr:phytoene/squalene synthase family protein [Saprospiraceae bacterium]